MEKYSGTFMERLIARVTGVQNRSDALNRTPEALAVPCSAISVGDRTDTRGELLHNLDENDEFRRDYELEADYGHDTE